MSFMKVSSIFLLSALLMGAFIPEANAKRHHCRNRSSFGLSFNLGGPGYVVAPAPAPAPVMVAPAPVYPVRSYVAPAPVYPYPYPYYYNAPVVVERPGVYVQPGFSYSYWRY